MFVELVWFCLDSEPDPHWEKGWIRFCMRIRMRIRITCQLPHEVSCWTGGTFLIEQDWLGSLARTCSLNMELITERIKNDKQGWKTKFLILLFYKIIQILLKLISFLFWTLKPIKRLLKSFIWYENVIYTDRLVSRWGRGWPCPPPSSWSPPRCHHLSSDTSRPSC